MGELNIMSEIIEKFTIKDNLQSVSYPIIYEHLSI